MIFIGIILMITVLVCGIGWYRSKKKIATLRARVARRDDTISDYIKTNETLVSEKDVLVAQVKNLEKRYAEKEQLCNNLIQKLDELSVEGQSYH